MLTRQELADILHGVNVADVAQRAKVAPKTIYRLRNLKNAPTLDTVAAILAAVDEIKVAATRQPAAQKG